MTKNRLKELRINHNYTLDDIEKLTGIKRGTYNNYENGNTEPKLKTWKKLANFYGVDVMYLQGLIPNFYEVTSKTKDFIISELDKNYFSDNKDTKYKKIRTELKQAVNEYANYAKLDPKPIEIKTDNDKARFKYWVQHFSFLFDAGHIINWVNRYIYFTSNKYTHHLTYGQFVSDLKERIKSQTIMEFQTDIGLFVSSKADNSLENAFNSFKRNLSFSKDINGLNARFDSYINFLNNLRSELNESIKSSNVKIFAEKKRLEYAIEMEFLNTVLKNDTHIDKEDSEKLSKKYGADAVIAILLRKYKLKNSQDVTEIDKYLDLLGIKDDVLSEFNNIDDSKKN